MDSVLLRGVALSGVLHAGAIAYVVMVLPERLANLPPGTEPIAVEVVSPGDVSRLPAPEASRDDAPQIARADTAPPEAPDTPPADDGGSQRVATLPAPARTEPAAREKPRSDDAESGPDPVAKPALAAPDQASGDAVADETAGRSTVPESAPESVAAAPRPDARDNAIAGRTNSPKRAADRAVSPETLDKPAVAAPDQASGDAAADEAVRTAVRDEATPEAAAPVERSPGRDKAVARQAERASAADDAPDQAEPLPKPAPIRRDAAVSGTVSGDTDRGATGPTEPIAETPSSVRPATAATEAPRLRTGRPSAKPPPETGTTSAPLPRPPAKKKDAPKPPVQQARRTEPPKQKRKPPPNAGFPLCRSLLPKLETRLKPSDCASVRNLLNHTLETARSGRMGIWQSPDRSFLGKVLPMESFVRPDGIPCREFIQTLEVDGEKRVASGTACRDRVRPVWRIAM